MTATQVKEVLARANAAIGIFDGDREVLHLIRQSAPQIPVPAMAAAEAEKAGLLGQIQLPKMISLSPNLSIMKGEVTVGLFRQVMGEYVPEGHNANALQAILNDPSQGSNALTFINLFDVREFATRLSDLTGRSFRVQTEGEWEAARNLLTGNNWTWTETSYSDISFVLRHLADSRGSNYPELRYNRCAARLVEDLK